MRDSEVVAAIVAGDPEGLAEAYDRYASSLYTYCRSLLRESADAADAVQDTFVIAASRLAGLRDRDRLRPWLYAVARNECHRRLRARTVQVTTPPAEMPDVTDTSADVSGEAERNELRTLLRSAIRGLNTGDQDLIELQLRQGLEVGEIAAVLGVSRNHAHALMSRARDQLEISLGALMVARSGREECAALDAMLQDWDGQLNVLMRKRINRHIERCPVCAERKKRELAPALLLGLAPLAALATAAVPPGLREQVLRLASSDTPDALAHRASVAQRTGPFGHEGFPKPLDPPRSARWHTRQVQAAAAGAAVVAVAAAVLIAVALAGGPAHHGGRPVAVGQGSGTPGAGFTSSAGATSSATAGLPGRPGHSARPGVSASGVANVAPSPTAGGASSTVGVSPSATAGSSAAPRPSTTAPSTTAPSTSRSPSPTSPAPSTRTSSPAAPAPQQGTLAVSPTTIVLSPLTGSSITLTASGGPVNFSVSESASLLGDVSVAPASGTLAAGQSTSIAVSAGSLASVDSQITINPGGHQVTVLIGVNLGALAVNRSAGYERRLVD
jgi:RNA polymerase sigma factor (sigma-70 family)